MTDLNVTKELEKKLLSFITEEDPGERPCSEYGGTCSKRGHS